MSDAFNVKASKVTKEKRVVKKPQEVLLLVSA